MSEDGKNCKQIGIGDLSEFIPERILTESSKNKLICILGQFKSKDGQAILYLEKTPFSEEIVQKMCTTSSLLTKNFVNDIYGSYSLHTDDQLNDIKVTLIYPATEKQIEKYRSTIFHLINETPELYESLTLKYIEESNPDLEWLYNILEHKKESDRIIYEDADETNGFILLPDLKWDQKLIENLHVLAIARVHGIKSLRDLNKDHLSLLKNIQNESLKVIKDKYNLPQSQIRAYLHYQPTFYHLHVHFSILKFDAPGIFAERAHLLSTVIENIELVGDYYQKVTLPFTVGETSKLFTKYSEIGIVTKFNISPNADEDETFNGDSAEPVNKKLKLNS